MPIREMGYEYKKSHHYIAQVHQRQFADASGQVYILNRNGKIYKTVPLNIFKESHYHTVKGSLKAENAFARLESEFGEVLTNQINRQQPLTASGRLIISYYVAAMLFRPKLQKKNMLDGFRQALAMGRDIQRRIQENPDIVQGFGPTSSGSSFTMEDIEKLLSDPNSHHTMLALRMMTDFGPFISNMNWVLFLAPGNETFICSDNPVGMMSPIREKQFGREAFRSSVGLADDDVQML